jgi:hypothetical protein
MPPTPRGINFRGVTTALIVEVLEGNGKDIPFQIIKYAINSEGVILGKITRDLETLD